MAKTCSRCHLSKSDGHFYPVTRRGKTSLSSRCRACISAEKKSRYWRDPVAARARQRDNQRRFRANNPGYWSKNMAENFPGGSREYQRLSHLRRTYGLTREAFLDLIEKQGGKCAICGKVPSADRYDRAWQVDHDHATGKVRGLLCRHCNWALGHLADDPARFRAALAYLGHH